MEESKIIIPHHISRGFVVKNPDFIFVYGCDVVGKACLGQAWNCYGEPNAFGIPTMIKYCSAKQHYRDDSGAANYQGYIDRAISLIPLDGRPIIVLPGIGRGCSRMFELSPKLYNYMIAVLDKIRHKNVEIDYNA